MQYIKLTMKNSYYFQKIYLLIYTIHFVRLDRALMATYTYMCMYICNKLKKSDAIWITYTRRTNPLGRDAKHLLHQIAYPTFPVPSWEFYFMHLYLKLIWTLCLCFYLSASIIYKSKVNIGNAYTKKGQNWYNTSQ